MRLPGAISMEKPHETARRDKLDRAAREHAETAATLRALLTERDCGVRLVFAMAPSFQGGHSSTGADAAAFLGLAFPIRMSDLDAAAKARGFDTAALWPWRRTPTA